MPEMSVFCLHLLIFKLTGLVRRNLWLWHGNNPSVLLIALLPYLCLKEDNFHMQRICRGAGTEF
jgi:hypothetical protein